MTAAPSGPPPAPAASFPPLTVVPSPAPARHVRTLAVLGDSTPAGHCDPVPGGGWRGFAVLLGAALAADTLVNTARTGARMVDVARTQVPAAVASSPDVAVLVAGMNDTMRSDFDPAALLAHCSEAVRALRAAGAHVVLMRYHDHTRLFRLPAMLGRALLRRIVALNGVIDAVAATDAVGISVLDLHRLPGGYDPTAWAVDRLHPSERGHRLLTAGITALLVDAGFAVPQPVSLECAGGRRVTAVHRVAWLLVKGIPWLVRRGRDLGPTIVQGLLSELRRSPRTEGGPALRRPGGSGSARPGRWGRPRRGAPRSATAAPACRSGTAR